VYQFDSIEQGVRAGDRAVLDLVALFQGAVGYRLVGQVDALGGQFQRFRDSATRVSQCEAESRRRFVIGVRGPTVRKRTPTKKNCLLNRLIDNVVYELRRIDIKDSYLALISVSRMF